MTYSPSGAGTSPGSISGSNDVALNNVSDQEVLGYDAELQKWRNLPPAQSLNQEQIQAIIAQTLVAGSGVTLTNNPDGTITVSAVASSGTTGQATAASPAGWEDFASLDVSAGGSFILRNDTDYKIVGQTAGGNVRLRGGRKVVVMGLTVSVDDVANWTTTSEADTTGLELQENPYPPEDGRSGGLPQAGRSFHVEGVLLRGNTLTQGIRMACPTADVTLVNCHIAKVRFDSCDHRDGTNSKTTNHPDLIQTYGGVKSLAIDGLTGYSAYQGMFFKEDNTIIGGPISLRRVDVHAVVHVGSDGVSYAGHRMLWNFRDQPITVESGSVWIDGHARNGWQPGGFYRERYFSSTGGDPVYTPAVQVADWNDGTVQGWTGSSGVITSQSTQTQEGSGAAQLSKVFAATGYDSVRMYDAALQRDVAVNGSVLACWVRIPSGTPGAAWRARLGVYRNSDNVLIEQTLSDGQLLTLGEWTLCTWDLSTTNYTGAGDDMSLLADIRRFHVRVGADNVNATVDVAVDNYTQGNFVPGPGYVDEPAPTGGTDAMALMPLPDTVNSDATGPYAEWTQHIAGKVYLGSPIREYVSAESVGADYQRN